MHSCRQLCVDALYVNEEFDNICLICVFVKIKHLANEH